MLNIQMDRKCGLAGDLMAIFGPVLRKVEFPAGNLKVAASILLGWNGISSAESLGAALFHMMTVN